MVRLILAFIALAAPAMAASGPFVSLSNTNFIVLVSFLIFVGILIYAGVPGMLTGMLDKRAATIKQELDEAHALREEAKDILAGYEKKKKEVQEQAELIIASARTEAMAAAEEAKAELGRSITRRLAAASDRIASAEKAAVREVRDRAVTVAVATAGEILAAQVTPASAKVAIDASIAEVGARLH